MYKACILCSSDEYFIKGSVCIANAFDLFSVSNLTKWATVLFSLQSAVYVHLNYAGCTDN